MASAVSVREDQIPLLQSHRDSIVAAVEEEILPFHSPPSDHQPPPQDEAPSKPGPTAPTQRLVSLDVFRGLTVAVDSSISLSP